jgi:hypothetical protein
MSAGALADARSKIDSLPAIVEALGKLPAALRDLPPAPVILGAASRMVADAIAKELTHRGPSPGFLAACSAAGVDDARAHVLFDELVLQVCR